MPSDDAEFNKQLSKFVIEVRKKSLDVEEPVYLPEDFARLNREQGQEVLAAEVGMIVALIPSVGKKNPAYMQRIHAEDIFLEDKELIDKPLAAKQKLSDAYLHVGLANDPDMEGNPTGEPNRLIANYLVDKFIENVTPFMRIRSGPGGGKAR